MKYLIVANGPFLSKSIILEAASNAYIIALDGAADKLIKLDIKPDIIFGDMDSLENSALLKDIKTIRENDQNFTDFQKAIKFAKNNHATSIHVVCATGGRMDHEFAVFQTLKNEHDINSPIFLHTEFQSVTFASNQTIKINGMHHDYCGLFGFPEALMIVKNDGLEYGGNKAYPLTSSQYSVSNRLTSSEGAIVKIKGDALIVNPPMLLSQRSRLKKDGVSE